MILLLSTEHEKFSISMNCINTEIIFEFIIPVRNIRFRLLQFNCNEGLYRWINSYSHSNHGLDLESDKGGFRCKLSGIDDVDFWRN